jgi:hypothetical protein
MLDLKVITLVTNIKAEGRFAGTGQYQALDESGKVLCSRYAEKARGGKHYIAGLVTKNLNHTFPYTIQNLFASFAAIGNKSPHKMRKPYAIAVTEEHKEAYNQWVKNTSKRLRTP